MTRPDTRTRILLASLKLFNEQGEPNTTTNQIANEVELSPGNLHYHFRRKSELIESLLAEFQADARCVLAAPISEDASVHDLWDFLHTLFELFAAYRFLFRDMETLVVTNSKVRQALRGFSKGLRNALQLHVNALRQSGNLEIEEQYLPHLSRNLATVSMFSERFDVMSGSSEDRDDTSLRVAHAVLLLLLPYSTTESKPLLEALTEQYSDESL